MQSPLFQYTLRDQNAYADPLKIRRNLLARTEGRLWGLIHDLNALKDERDGFGTEVTPELVAKRAVNDQAVAYVEGVLANATILAFDFTPVDPATGQGLTEMEALHLLSEFVEYAEGKE